MKLVYRHQEGGDRPGSGILRRSLVLVAVLALLAGGAVGANAAPAARSAVAAQSSFCGIAAGVASTVVNPSSELVPTNATSLVTLESKLKTVFEKFESAEPGLIAAAPGQIKGDLQKVFSVDNALFQDLKKANWNFMALATDAKSLQASESKIKAPLTAIEAYLKSSCGIKT